jgi:hypothetical protein
MIYRFILGYRTLHMRQPSNKEVQQRPDEDWAQGRLDWAYFVCKCGPAAHGTLSEYAVGQIWAGDADVDDMPTAPGRKLRKKDGWRRAIPACAFRDDTDCAAIEKGDTTVIQEKLHLDLLRVSKLVHAEARDALFATNIFAFSQRLALAECTIPHEQFGHAHLARIRNVILCVQPLKIDMCVLNGFLRDINDGIGIDNLTGLRKLQIVVKCDTKNVDETRYDWTEMWRVTGLLSFAKIDKLEVAVDVRSAYDRKNSTQRDRADKYARMLEGRIARPWDVVKQEVEALWMAYEEKARDAEAWVDGVRFL